MGSGEQDARRGEAGLTWVVCWSPPLPLSQGKERGAETREATLRPAVPHAQHPRATEAGTTGTCLRAPLGLTPSPKNLDLLIEISGQRPLPRTSGRVQPGQGQGEQVCKDRRPHSSDSQGRGKQWGWGSWGTLDLSEDI